ncbi:MAG: putative dsRNA-binding protein [Candidatus Absconditabacterales bacterium]|nr:putative dsRNA-binding protein [Candidatus Absconditabacterales bacterium]
MFETRLPISPAAVLHKPALITRSNKRLGRTPGNLDLLVIASIHKSHARDFTGNHAHNERLEFMGDAVIEHVVCQWLWSNLSDDEANLSMYKVFLIRTETLADVCKECERSSHILLSHGEEINKGREKDSILADCFEALMGYCMIDYGWEWTAQWLTTILIDPRRHLLHPHHLKNPKSLLQERCQAHYKILPIYDTQETSNDGTHIVFHSTVRLNNDILGIGSGPNKKKAEENAARDARKRLS